MGESDAVGLPRSIILQAVGIATIDNSTPHMQSFSRWLNRLFYEYLRWMARIGAGIFHKRLLHIGADKVARKGPQILAVNHPNTLMDVLLTVSYVKGRHHFLANASLFKHPLVDKILRYCWCIPIRRTKDTSALKVDNAASFREAIKHLKQDGKILIAPEGTSYLYRRVRPLKTGTARIALAAELVNRFRLGLTIQPVGQTYYKAPYIGAEARVEYGTPIVVADYKTLYLKDKKAAAQQLTHDLEQRLRDLTVHTRDERTAEVLAPLHELWQAQQRGRTRLEEQYDAERAIAEHLERLRDHDAAAFEELRSELLAWHSEVVAQGVTIQQLYLSLGKRSQWWLECLLLSPLALFGAVNHFLPHLLPLWIVNRVRIYRGYYSTIKVLTGLFTYPIFYTLQIALVAYWTMHWLWVASYIGLLLLSRLAMDAFYHKASRLVGLQKVARVLAPLRAELQRRGRCFLEAVRVAM